jgi:hypothetical protein
MVCLKARQVTHHIDIAKKLIILENVASCMALFDYHTGSQGIIGLIPSGDKSDPSNLNI